jgi:mono/diheme cytochrome c family protein
MKKALRIGVYTLSGSIVLVASLLVYVKLALPNVGPAPDIKIASSPQVIERGQYLANSVAVCMDCHSSRDWSYFAGPPIMNTLGMGGEKFDQSVGFPGAYYAKNITPAGLSGWTDGEIYRAITSGVSKDGSPLFSIMPHHNYGKLATEDIYAIIAYLRTLKPIENKIPPASSDFPMNFIINTIPMKAAPQAIPDTSDPVLYGKYLFTVASCNDCHTKQDKGQPITGMELAGGFEFPVPTGTVRSSNITPDKETGIGDWSEEAFVNRFKVYSDTNYHAPKVEGKGFNTIMPWLMYTHMKREDLAAIYAYLKTVKPVKNQVVKFTPKE